MLHFRPDRISASSVSFLLRLAIYCCVIVLFAWVQCVLKSGWLYKRGKVVRSWRKRWFVLTRSALTYYPDADTVGSLVLFVNCGLH